MRLARSEAMVARSPRNLSICVRQLEALPPFARELVDLLMADAKAHR